MPYFFIRFFENTLLLSMTAAFARGPKARMPAASSASTMPAASGSSGATKTRSTGFSCANRTTPSMSIAPMSTPSASAAMPPLPGAHQSLSVFGLSFSLRTIACSRPPLPITKMFMYCLPYTAASAPLR